VSSDHSIAAEIVVRSPPEVVFAFLAEMHNHWTLAGRRIELLEIGQAADGSPCGVVMIRGPLGIRRRARTRVLRVCKPSLLGGVAEVGAGTRAHVQWDLKAAGEDSTLVSLSAVLANAGPVDRLLLLAGGRIWMRRVFAATLRLLAERLDAGKPAPALEAA
jgi:hypothetical protein